MMAADPGEQVFGHYRILKVLGEGGMGVVYLAEDKRLGRQVALKRLKGEDFLLESNPDEIKRFEREVKSAGQLDHPAIVKVFEFGMSGGEPFFTMELVPGEGLDQVLQDPDENLGPEAAAALCLELAGAIDHAHSHGIIHRDLKPSNVLVDENYHPHLLDFGLAKRTAEDSGFTRTGVVLGTPRYLAPEQVDASLGAVGPATDVYGLGAILYECLTGEPPNRGDSEIKILFGAVNEPVIPPRQIDPEVPPVLEAICLRALEKKQARRYASIREMGADLERFFLGWRVSAQDDRRLVNWITDNKKKVIAVAILLISLFVSSSILGARARSQRAGYEEGVERARQELRGALSSRDARTSLDRAVELEALGDLEPEDEDLISRAMNVWSEHVRSAGEDLLRRSREEVEGGSLDMSIELARMASMVCPDLEEQVAERVEESLARTDIWVLDGKEIPLSDLTGPDSEWVALGGWFYSPEELVYFGLIQHEGKWVDRRQVDASGLGVVLDGRVMTPEEARDAGYTLYEGGWFLVETLQEAGLVEMEDGWREIDALVEEGYCYLEGKGWIPRDRARERGALVQHGDEWLTPLELKHRGLLPYRGGFRDWKELFTMGVAGTREEAAHAPLLFGFRNHAVMGRIVEWVDR